MDSHMVWQWSEDLKHRNRQAKVFPGETGVCVSWNPKPYCFGSVSLPSFLLNCQSYMQFQCGTRQVLGGLMTLGFVMLELVVFLKSQAAPAGREFHFPGVTPLPTSINSKWAEHPVLRFDGWLYSIPAVPHRILSNMQRLMIYFKRKKVKA